MCSGDMTPIPTEYYPSIGKNYIVGDVPHTCRNFKQLQGWLLDRFEGPGAVTAAFPSQSELEAHLRTLEGLHHS